METNSSNYTWSQTENELEIRIPLSSAFKAKDVSVEFKKTHLRAGIKGQKPIIDGELENEIDCSDDGATTWVLENSGKELVITFDKNKTWKKLLKTDELNLGSTTTEEQPDRDNPVDIDKLAADLIAKMGRPIDRPDPAVERKRQEIKDKLKIEHPDIDFEKCIFN